MPGLNGTSIGTIRPWHTCLILIRPIRIFAIFSDFSSTNT
jgi:hypothetical protein